MYFFDVMCWARFLSISSIYFFDVIRLAGFLSIWNYLTLTLVMVNDVCKVFDTLMSCVWLDLSNATSGYV